MCSSDLGQALVSLIGKHDAGLYEILNRIIVRGNVDYYTGVYGVLVSTKDCERKAIKDDAATEIEAIKATELTPAAKRKSVKGVEARESALLANVSVKYAKIIKVIQTIGMRWEFGAHVLTSCKLMVNRCIAMVSV